MLTTTIDKTDTELKTDVLAELRYEPSVNVTDIGVLVNDGTVTLNGYAASYAEKWSAVHAVKRVVGVKAIAYDIEVKLVDSYKWTDGDIATAAANHLSWSPAIIEGSVQVTVRGGWVTLDGEVEWWYQKSTAETTVRHLSGVKGVINRILIKPTLTVTNIESSIAAAFERNALVDSSRIQVEVKGSKVTLTGAVRNHAEKEEAERVVWAAPGVYAVDNHLKVEFSWGFRD